LIAISEGNEATRRRAPRRELTALGNRQSVEDVLDTFGTARLLTFDRDPVTRAPTVEVAHEALLREWARLYRWIEEARVDVRLERRLASATAEWTAADRDASYLLAGNRLDLFEAWRSGTDIALTSIEQEFLETSIEKRTALELAEASRREREERLERRSVTRLRFLAAVLAVAAIVAASLTVFAFNQRDRARDQTDLAERQAELAQRNAVLSNARALTAEAVTSVAVDPQLSILLALAAADETTSVGEPVLTETIEALHLALPASRVRMTLPGGSGSFSPDGRRLVTADPGILRSQGDAQGTATVWDVASGTEVLVLTGHTGRTFDAVFSPDGSRIATTSSDGTARLWDASTGSLERALSGHQGSVFAVEFNPDGSLVATTGADGTVRIWDTATGEELLKLDVGTTATGLAFSTDGKLAVAADQQGVLLWDVATGTRLATLDAGGEGMCDVAFGPDGALVATVSLDQTVRLWDALTGVELRSFEGHNGPVCGVDFSPDGGRLATAGEDGVARIWEIETGRNVLTLAGHDTGVGCGLRRTAPTARRPYRPCAGGCRQPERDRGHPRR
jgi:WD40 repeat protein